MAKPTAFTKQAALRVVKATRTVERMGGSSGGGWHPYRADDGEAIKVAKATNDWAKGTCATVEAWTAGKQCIPEKNDPTEQIKDVANLLFDIRKDSWVVVAQAVNGRWYVIAAGGPDDGCEKVIGGQDVTKWSGWDETKNQILGHDDSGCLVWFDAFDCNETGTTP